MGKVAVHCVIVDNGSSHLRELVQLCGPGRSTVVPVEQLAEFEPPVDCLFVLSGRHQHHAQGDRHPVAGNDAFYRPELKLIGAAKHPIVGVCLGFELIAHQAGARLVQISHPETGTVDIFPTPEGANWFPPHQLKVAEGHRWVVQAPPQGYIPLAYSKDGIEAIANLSRRIVGFQFHPEHNVDNTDGAEVFQSVVERISHE
jgi:GMP synthase-like glutamine amidotransferase